MDLRSLKVAETAFLHLKGPEDELLYAPGTDGQPDKSKPVGITFYGPGSKPFQRASAAKHQRLMEKLRRKGNVKQTAAEIRADDAEFLTAITSQFHEIERDDADGNAMSGEALYRATFEDLEIGFIAEQSNAYVGDWANFSKGSAKPSPSTSASSRG